MPRMNTVLNCSSTGWPLSSVLTTRLVNRVPERPTRMAYASEWVLSVMPGTSGWWKCMSCSPCTMNGMASGGMMSAAARSMPSHVGTTPNTGGAYLPDV